MSNVINGALRFVVLKESLYQKTDGDSRMSEIVNSLYCPAPNQALTCLKASQFLIKLKCLHHWHVRKKCGITFNQISCASFIDCLMEIMNHSTSTSTPTVIWRTSCSAPHCQSPSDVKIKCVKDTETARSPTCAADTGQLLGRGGPFTGKIFLIRLCSFN